MLIRKKFLLTLWLLLFALTGSFLSLIYFSLIPTLYEVETWEDLLMCSGVPPYIPIWMKLLIFVCVTACFVWAFITLCTFRPKVLDFLLQIIRFCEELGNGRYPAPFSPVAAKNAEIRELLQSLNIIRDRLISSVNRLRSSHNREVEARRITENNAELRSMLIARVVPDMRAPINNAAGFTELLANEEAIKSGRGKEYVDGLRRALVLMTRYLGRIQKIGAISKIGTELNIGNFRTESLMQQLHEQNDFLLSEQSMTLQTPYLPEMPEYLRTDQEHLLQLLGLMLRGVARASGAGEVLQCLCIHTENGVEFHVSDTGKVSCREELAQLYTHIRQDPALTGIRDAGTSVLGMVFLDAQAALFGGKISAQKGKNASNEFVLSFSAADIAADAPETTRTQTFHSSDTPYRTSAPAREEDEFDGREYSILVGEDDPDNAMILERLLQRNHCHTFRSTNGEDLVKSFAGGIYDAIVLSQTLPCNNLYHLIRRLLKQANNPLFPILILANDDTPLIRKELNRAGARCILLKPLDFPLMIRQLRGLCRKD